MTVTIKRIAKLSTFKHYKSDLQSIIPKYLEKSKCPNTANDLLNTIKLECYNPMYSCCIILEDDTPKGFIISRVMFDSGGSKIVIDNLHTPNMKVAAKVYKLIVGKLTEEFSVSSDRVFFFTYRNPESWVRYAKKVGIEVELSGWLLTNKQIAKE